MFVHSEQKLCLVRYWSRVSLRMGKGKSTTCSLHSVSMQSHTSSQLPMVNILLTTVLVEGWVTGSVFTTTPRLCWAHLEIELTNVSFNPLRSNNIHVVTIYYLSHNRPGAAPSPPPGLPSLTSLPPEERGRKACCLKCSDSRKHYFFETKKAKHWTLPS